MSQGTSGTTGTTCMPLKISAGANTNFGNGTATFIGLGTQLGGFTKCAIGHCRTNIYDIGSIVFCCNNAGDTTSVTMSDERMRITSTGNVGIGTNAIPSNSLPNIASTLFIGSQGYGICGDATMPEAGIYIGDGQVSARWRIAHGNANLNLHQNNGSGTYNYRGAFANSTGAYSSVSDERLKKLIEPIQYGLNDVLKFKPVSYLMENQNEDTDKKNLGFIAQDLEYIIPEIVNVPSSSNAVYSLQYTSIIPILIKAIQELNEIVTKNTNTSNMMV